MVMSIFQLCQRQKFRRCSTNITAKKFLPLFAWQQAVNGSIFPLISVANLTGFNALSPEFFRQTFRPGWLLQNVRRSYVGLFAV